MGVIYVQVKTNDVLATSFRAMHGRKFRDGACAVRSARDALHLNETRTLPAQFEFPAVTPLEIHYAVINIPKNI